MIRLSIIIPIYKVEDYLRKCVNSVLNQDLSSSEYEIILVDDGSPDACPQICDQYAADHDNIRVVHRENGGLSAARNSGIEIAQGKYMMFVDSDDYIESNVLGELVRTMDEKQLDVLRYNYQNVRVVTDEGMNGLRDEWKYEVFEPFKAAKRDVDYSEVVTDGETFLNERLGPGCYAWAFIIRHDLIMSVQKSEVSIQTDDRCLFTEGIYFEDTEWTPRMLLRAKRVASTPMVVYNYLWRSGSITLPTDPVKREKVIRDKIALLYGFNEQRKLVANALWFDWMTSFNTMTVLNALIHLSSSERKPYLQELKSLQIFPLSTKKEKILSHKIKIMLANLSPSLYCNLMSKKI